jgi:hypothetical protein
LVSIAGEDELSGIAARSKASTKASIKAEPVSMVDCKRAEFDMVETVVDDASGM